MEAEKQLLYPAAGLSNMCLLRSQMGVHATTILYYSWFQSISMHITDITPCWRMMRFDISMCIAIKDNKLLLHLSGRPTNAQ
jgi:hypothetical protein